MKTIFLSIVLLLSPSIWAQKLVVKVYPELHGLEGCVRQTEQLKTKAILKDNFYLGLENQLAYPGQSLNPFGLESPRIYVPGRYFLKLVTAYLHQGNMIYHAKGNAVPHNNEKVYVSLRNALLGMLTMFDAMEHYEKQVPEFEAIVMNDPHMIHDLQQVSSVYSSVDAALNSNNSLTVVSNLNPINSAMTTYLNYFYQNKKMAVKAIVDDEGLAKAKEEYGIASPEEINVQRDNLTNFKGNQINYITSIHPQLINEYIEYSLINKNYMFLDNIFEYIQENGLESSDSIAVIVGKNHVFGMQRLVKQIPQFKEAFELEVQEDCASIEDFDPFKR